MVSMFVNTFLSKNLFVQQAFGPFKQVRLLNESAEKSQKLAERKLNQV